MEAQGEIDIEIDILHEKLISASPAWSSDELWSEGSTLRNLLSSLPGAKDGKVTKLSLKCLALFWCQGSAYDRSELVLECINPKC